MVDQYFFERERLRLLLLLCERLWLRLRPLWLGAAVTPPTMRATVLGMGFTSVQSSRRTGGPVGQYFFERERLRLLLMLCERLRLRPLWLGAAVTPPTMRATVLGMRFTSSR